MTRCHQEAGSHGVRQGRSGLLAERFEQETTGVRGTRRGFLAGAAAAGATPLLALPVAEALAETRALPCEPDPPGIPTGAIAVAPGGRTVWSTDTHARTIT